MATASQPFDKTPFRTELRIWEFFRRELAPTPGRLSWAMRVSITSVIMLLIGEACRSELLFIALFIPLTLPRDSPQQTWAAAKGTIMAACSGTVAAIFLVMLVADLPWARVSVMAFAIFCSYILSRGLRQPVIGILCPVITTLVLTRLDSVNSAEVAITTAFWVSLMMSAGALVATAVEFLYPHPSPQERVAKGIRDRLEAAAAVFNRISGAELSGEERQQAKRVEQLALAGTSSLRKLLPALAEKHSGDENFLLRFSAFLNGMDIFCDRAAQVSRYSSTDFNEQQKAFALGLSQRCKILADYIKRGAITPPESEAARIAAGSISNMGHGQLLVDTSSQLEDLWRICSYEMNFSPAAAGPRPNSSGKAKPPLGPFFSTDNIHFAFKVTLASMICYFIYNGVDWQGLNPAMLTCYLIADNTIGSTFRKLTLRLTGATVGGLLFGIGGISLVLSHLSNIAEFALYVAVVFFISGWVANGGPKLSYAGSQMGLAFGLVALMHPVIPSLIVEPRDRFVSVLLGGVAMWLVFTRLWPVDTLAVQKRNVAGLIRIAGALRVLAEDEGPKDIKIAKLGELRDSINQGITKTQDQADTSDYESKDKQGVELALNHCFAKIRDLLMLGMAEADLSIRAVNLSELSDEEGAATYSEYLCFLAQMVEGSEQSAAQLQKQEAQLQARLRNEPQLLEGKDDSKTDEADGAFRRAKTQIRKRRNDLLAGIRQSVDELEEASRQLSAAA